MKPTNSSTFAGEWVESWNSHNLKSIMAHYSEELQFSSPVIQQMNVNDDGIITSKKELEDYFEKALKKYPDLKFELISVLTGVSSVVLFYKSINDLFSAEYMELDESGKVVKVKAHYSTP